jgi:hypothetical protein
MQELDSIIARALRVAEFFDSIGHSEKSALKLGMSAIPLGADIRGLLRNDGRSGTRLKDLMVKVQTTLVASPGFGPIFGRFAHNGPVFGIGGFEPGI